MPNTNITGMRLVQDGQKSQVLNLSNARRKTYAQLENMSAAQKKGVIICEDYPDGGAAEAEDIAYDNTTSQMTATNVQGAIDELNTGLVNAGTVRYDKTTKWIQLLDDDGWFDWRKAGRVINEINTADMETTDWEKWSGSEDTGAYSFTKSSNNQFTVAHTAAPGSIGMITRQKFNFPVGTVLNFVSNLKGGNPFSELCLSTNGNDSIHLMYGMDSSPVTIPTSYCNQDVYIIVLAAAAGTTWDKHVFSLYSS